MMKAEMPVPGNAKRDMVQKFLKNSFLFIANPASNMMGGSSKKKKSSGSNVKNFNSSSEGYIILESKPTLSERDKRKI